MTNATSGWITFECLEVTQPIGTFYVGVMDSADLARFSYSDVRRIAGERREVESYLGIERPLSRKRVEEISEYVRTLDASFPSSIIVAVESKHTQYDREKGLLSLRDQDDIAKILDGQHRIAGLYDYDGTFQLIVSVFVDMDIDNQAMLFATINLEQTKVNKSLVYDLHDYTKARSPQKTSHNIVKLLNDRKGSPFHGKFKMLGVAGEPEETLSQATFVDALLPLISTNPRKDRDDLKRGRNIAPASDELSRKLVFRNLFIQDDDARVARVVWNYFAAVAARWPTAWSATERGMVLNRTTGFAALMRLLPVMYSHEGQPGELVTEETFGSAFDAATINDDEFTSENFKPGSSGQAALFRRLLDETGL